MLSDASILRREHWSVGLATTAPYVFNILHSSLTTEPRQALRTYTLAFTCAAASRIFGEKQLNVGGPINALQFLIHEDVPERYICMIAGIETLEPFVEDNLILRNI